MQKRNLSLISFILLAVFEVFAFTPAIVKLRAWEPSPVYYHGIYLHTVYSNKWDKLQSLSEQAYYRSFPGILVYVCLIAALIGIIALILQFINKNSKTINILTFSPAVSSITLILYAVFEMLLEQRPDNAEKYGYLTVEPAWGFYVELALILAVAIMSVLIALGKVKNTPVAIYNRTFEVDAADGLLKYKQLLDEGIISQEEFEAKKKQLLDL